MRFVYTLRYERWYYTNDFGYGFPPNSRDKRCLKLILTDGEHEYIIDKPTRAVGFYMFREQECTLKCKYEYNFINECLYLKLTTEDYALLITELMFSDEENFRREEIDKITVFY